MLSVIHTMFGFISLLLGLIVISKRKGNKTHRYIGRLYVFSMVMLCFTSFGLFNLYGSFGIFHIAALVSLTSIAGGITAVYLKNRISNWLHWHYQCMSWSYLGLLGGTSNEAFAHISPLVKIANEYQFIPNLALLFLFLIGGIYINVFMGKFTRGLRWRNNA